MLNIIFQHNLKDGILWYLVISLNLSCIFSTEPENEVSSDLGRRRTPRSMTTICVEIKPSGPKEEPYYMCKGTAEEQAMNFNNEQILGDQANYGSANPLVNPINQQIPLQYFPDQMNLLEKPWKAISPTGLGKNPASQSMLANGYEELQWSPPPPPASYFQQQQQQFGNVNPGEEFMQYHQAPPQPSLSTNPHQLPTQSALLPSSQFPSPQQNHPQFHSQPNNHYFPQSSPQQIIPSNKPNHGYHQDQSRPHFQNPASYAGTPTATNHQHLSAASYPTPNSPHEGTGLPQSQHPFSMTATQNGPGHGVSAMVGPNGFNNDHVKHFGGIRGGPNNLPFSNPQSAGFPITQQISTVPSVHRTAAAAMSTALADRNPISRPETTFSNTPKPTASLKNDYELARSSNGSQRVNDQRGIADEHKADDIDQLRYRPLTPNDSMNGHGPQNPQNIGRANKFAKPIENKLEPNQLSPQQQQQQQQQLPPSMFGFSEQELDNLSPIVGAAPNQLSNKPNSRTVSPDFSDSALMQQRFASAEEPPIQEDPQVGARLSQQPTYNSYPVPPSNNYYNPNSAAQQTPAVSPIQPVNTIQSPGASPPPTVCVNNLQQQQPCVVAPPTQPIQCNTNGLVQIGPQWSPPYNYNIQPLLIGLPFYGQQQQQQQQNYETENLLSDARHFGQTNSPTGFLGASSAFGLPILGLANTFGWVTDKLLSAKKSPVQCPRTGSETAMGEENSSEAESGSPRNVDNETKLESNGTAVERPGLDRDASTIVDNGNATILASSIMKEDSEMVASKADDQQRSEGIQLKQNSKPANSTRIEGREKEAIESSVPMEEETKRTFQSLLEMAQKAKQLNSDEVGRIKQKTNKTRIITLDRVKN